ncbi:phage terminase large subunit family protein [Escherichia coli]|nr:phage terminase large subunit family protein [Escherichia coli]
MEVNKKQLADIFGASIRTIQNWQEQGMPVLRGGGKGNEVLYDSAAVIKWYAERDAEIENEKLRREVEELRQASETDLQPGTIEYERHRLTRAQADAQELKNARDSAEVVETAFCTFVLSRIAGEIASILDGIWTCDGILWFSSSGEEIEPPDSVTFHIWTAYSPFTTWVQIVKDWMKTKGDTGKRKTFVNTTLGETWEAKIGERPDAEVMAERKEYYSAPVPDRVAYLTAGIDSQLDRYEMRVWGWGPGEESWLIDRQIIMGRHDDEQTLLRVDEAINKTYTRRNGAEMSVSRICWDTGGIDPTIVYERSKKHGLFRVIPIKGASVYGKPVASMPRKRNKNGVYLTEIGTDTAKEQIYNRFTLTPEGDEPLPGAVHFPNNPDIFDLTEAQQLTAEEQVEKWVDGRKKILWDSKKRRNEALDCFVYALAALRISISRWQLDLSALLASLQEEDGAATNKKTLADYARALSGEDE